MTAEQIARSKLTGQPSNVKPDQAREYDQRLLDRADDILAAAWGRAKRIAHIDPVEARIIYDLGQLLGASVRRAHEKETSE